MWGVLVLSASATLLTYIPPRVPVILYIERKQYKIHSNILPWKPNVISLMQKGGQGAGLLSNLHVDSNKDNVKY